MKFLLALTTLVAAALAAPASLDIATLEKRQSADGFTRGGCKRVIMVYARGSTELGNVGTLGPSLESGLSRKLNRDFALQGVEYPADLLSNVLPDGTNKMAIRTMAGLFNDIYARCPGVSIAAGGYSQGSAVATNAINEVSAEVRDAIKATVLFGYTKNLQNRQRIPNYPQDRTLIICNIGDLVCTGTLIIMPAHLTYLLDVGKAVDFIAARV